MQNIDSLGGNWLAVFSCSEIADIVSQHADVQDMLTSYLYQSQVFKANRSLSEKNPLKYFLIVSRGLQMYLYRYNFPICLDSKKWKLVLLHSW